MLSGRSILVPPGLALKPIIEADLSAGPREIRALEQGEKARVQLRLEYSEDAGQYEIAHFGVDRRDLALEIGGTLLRTVKVHAIARRAIAYSLPIWTLGVIMLRDKRRTRELDGLEPFAPTAVETLHLTALVYRIAEISNENPAFAVAETMGLKQRTATNWIARARAAGYMTTVLDQAAARRIAMGLFERMGIEEAITEEEHQEFLASLVGRDGDD
ncbi:hypothetical protein HF576_09930 [Microbacterium sp. CFH 90308]|uniref:Uncharacterized protein n=1 Tax=Microbacterium salsuginis TaxID=2722803 RepID=A0ABX1KC15_9MICO|nr:hypothetical protein [Microbacterium sp. CFH 90308]NLP84170.1 hypothetical protein [Microbacterium sp. CFH 90308]